MRLLLLFVLVLFSCSIRAEVPVGEWLPAKGGDKAVILIGGAEGGLAWQYLPDQIDILQAAGFSVFRTAYFNHSKMPGLLEEIDLDYFRRVIDWVAAQNREVTIIAHSRGTEAALISAIDNDKLNRLILISPASHVFQGIKMSLEATVNDRRSAWSRDGKALPFVPFDINDSQLEETEAAAEKGEMCACVLDVYRQSLARAEPEARIVVERVEASILFVSSELDPIWPATKMADSMVAQRRELGKQSIHWKLSGGHMPHAAEDNWQRIVDWIKR